MKLGNNKYLRIVNKLYYLCLSVCLCLFSCKEEIAEEPRSVPVIEEIMVLGDIAPGKVISLGAKVIGVNHNNLTYYWQSSLGTISNPDKSECSVKLPNSADVNTPFRIKLVVSSGEFSTQRSEQFSLIRQS